MNENAKCPFCYELVGIPFYSDSKIGWYNRFIQNKNNIVYKGKHINIILDFSPLAIGHVLIIPERHILSFCDATDYEIFILLKVQKELRKYFEGKNTPVEFFEHGSGSKSSAASVNHAHFHCIPTTESIMQKMNIKLRPLEKDIQSLKGEKGYLYIEDIHGSKYYNNENEIVSQYMKYAYSELFHHNHYDWKTFSHDCTDILNETLKVYSNFKICAEF